MPLYGEIVKPSGSLPQGGIATIISIGLVDDLKGSVRCNGEPFGVSGRLSQGMDGGRRERSDSNSVRGGGSSGCGGDEGGDDNGDDYDSDRGDQLSGLVRGMASEGIIAPRRSPSPFGDECPLLLLLYLCQAMGVLSALEDTNILRQLLSRKDVTTQGIGTIHSCSQEEGLGRSSSSGLDSGRPMTSVMTRVRSTL